MTTMHVSPPLTDRADGLAERIFGATIGTLELFSIHVGRRLGLYAHLADGRPRTVDEVAMQCGVAPRYAREWLEQQAVAGFLDLAVDSDDASLRRYRLADDHARVLADADDPLHVAPFSAALAGIGQALPHVVDAYRTGDGVPYHLYGEDFRDGQGGINRPAFSRDLVETWLPALPDVHRRLMEGARVADVGCGVGFASLAVARAFPSSTVTGIDTDAGSIADAQRQTPSELADRLRFVTADGADADRHGPFDLVLVLETLHDIGDPVAALSGIRSSLADGGVVLVADERVAERYTAPGDEIERMMYGWSVTACLPAAVTDGGPGAVGTAIRPATVRRVATEAGFGSVEVLPIENELFRFYRLEA
ncbi:MAG TPA: class I SAM-dependent methyltransferase [Egicoccus sp.]|nr:class I SAM-dependent methyltransferase [Egicoccus sp.]HSK22104.1 class I SAM-dependent methyltransferase [Egicoccus sp.]